MHEQGKLCIGLANVIRSPMLPHWRVEQHFAKRLTLLVCQHLSDIRDLTWLAICVVPPHPHPLPLVQNNHLAKEHFCERSPSSFYQRVLALVILVPSCCWLPCHSYLPYKSWFCHAQRFQLVLCCQALDYPCLSFKHFVCHSMSLYVILCLSICQPAWRLTLNRSCLNGHAWFPAYL